MTRITGTYAVSTTLGEPVRAFIPHALPPTEPVLADAVWRTHNDAAVMALQRLSAVAGLVPSVDWLLYSAIRQEALMTSQIEGTQATLVDLFDDEAGLAISNTDDVEEVTNYLQAFQWVQAQLRSPQGLPISVRLLSEAHRRLLDGARGSGKQPGELRRSQNWIGGTRPGNAVFVPPPADQVPALLTDLERFIHAEQTDLPALVRVALVHAQFETIHPYLDGNGRIGRLLIASLLEHWQLLPEPLMYLSGYLKQHQSEYYRRLSAIRTDGDWEGWVQFFLEAVQNAAAQSERAVVALASLVANDRRRLLAHPKANAVSYRLFELLPTMPRLSVDRVCEAVQTTFPTANTAIKLLEELGILTELTGQKKNRTFSYAGYIQLLSQ
ncbi:cell filamentation protein Fic [Limnohabitans sp. TS-CS-82]|uniref:Fic family protein n=1 Tax=Limnohabitans sp. TS-CS-82 TaxID=2094193 RepID=UPI000CF2BC3B|nr:Fic family protein [Limnohabitans sp. TS-CS-82]PQA82905.1 cell filamentation protein Fic [Limnohabitans sp. TS-CS-82]